MHVVKEIQRTSKKCTCLLWIKEVELLFSCYCPFCMITIILGGTFNNPFICSYE